MTTIDLLHCYPPHKGDEMKAPDSSKPNLAMPDLNHSQYFDPKTKLLHEMLDSVVKDLANSQPEPASPWEGTLWRSPLRPRSPSPTYSEISDSFGSPARIEHCTEDLLSTPVSPTSAKVNGPDGWPLGIEVAMNDFHRGRLSTPILEKTELPNPLIVRKRQQQTSCFGGANSRERQETGSCMSVATEGQCDSQCQQESLMLRPLAFQNQQSNVLFQQYDEGQDSTESASLKPRPSEQLGFTGLHQQSDCQYQYNSVDLQSTELQEQSDGGSQEEDFLYVPTLSARRYGSNDYSSLRNANTDLDPALTNDNLPIGLALDNDSENARLEYSIFQSYAEEHDDYHAQTDGTYSLPKDCRQVVFSNALSANKEIDEHAEPRLSTLVDAVDACSERTGFSKVIGAFDNIGAKSLDHKTGLYNTLEDSGDNKLHLLKSPAPEDRNVNTDSDLVSWRSSGLLKDVVEGSEDLLTHTKTLNQRQPQHSTLGSAQPLHIQEAGEACERRINMLALQEPNTKQRTPSSSPQRVPPALKLTIIPSTTSQSKLTKQSKRRPSDKKLAQPIPSAATMAQLKDSTRKEGRLSPAALAEMRKTARSQPHFQTGPNSPEDQSQAQIHPLLRSKSRPSSPPSNIASNPALKYVFEDDDSECHENEREDGVGHWTSMEPCSSFETQAQNAESSTNHAFNEEYIPLQSGKAMGNTMPKILYKKEDNEGQEAGHTESSNDNALELSSKSMTLPSSMLPANWPLPMDGPSLSAFGSLDVLPSSIFQAPVFPATPGYYPDSAIGSPATYNSWASTPHHHEHGNPCGTPSSAITLHTSAVPTLNSTLCSNSPASGGMTMTPASSVGRTTVNLPASRGSEMTPSSSFGQLAGKTPNSRRAPITPSSSLGDFTDSKLNRRSVSISSVFAHYRKARNAGLPTPATTDSIASSKESAEWVQSREIANDPFTSAHDSNTSFSLIVKAPSKENLSEIPSKGTDRFNTPTRRSSGRFSLPRRSLSTCRRSDTDTNEDLEHALSSLIFNPSRSRPQGRSDRASRPIDSAKKPDGSGLGRGTSLNIATNEANTNWEIAPQPTPLCLRDEFSMHYRPEPVEAHDHHATRKDALQGVKHGLRKVFGRQ